MMDWLRRPHRNWIRDVTRVSMTSILFAGALSATPAIALLLFSFSFDFATVCKLIASGALFALTYRMIFRSAKRSGVKVGLTLAIYHWIFSGIVLGFSFGLGPMFLGAGLLPALNILISHLVFGGLFGFMFDRLAIRYELPRPLCESDREEEFELPLAPSTAPNSSMLQ